MADEELVRILREDGVEAWNAYAAEMRQEGRPWRADLVNADLVNADLKLVNLSGANLIYTNLSGANLAGANLSDADLTRANLKGANLSSANLSDANLFDAQLSGANLRGADLRHAHLSGVDLDDADLTRANLTPANLVDANLRGANLGSANLGSAKLNGANLKRANLSDADLTRAKLKGANLSDANLNSANLHSTILKGANLRDAHLGSANLSDANLIRANLMRADLSGANLSGAHLTHASLRGADLRGANLGSAKMRGAKLNDAKLGYGSLGNLELRGAVGLEEIVHLGPSTVGIDTLYRSQGDIPDVFLRGCGVPDDFIQYTRGLVGTAIDFYSCFISYSHADKAFARRLHDQLQGRGIRCWLDEHELLPGDAVQDQIDRGIRLWDKVLVCCSEASLGFSAWVDIEVEKAMQKEAKIQKKRGKRAHALIPLNLDNYLFDHWESGMASVLKGRLAADFRGWESDNAKFEEQFEKIVKALETGDAGRTPPPTPKL